MNTPLQQFLQQIQHAWTNELFIKLALGNFNGTEPDLKNIYVKKILLKDSPTLSFTYRFKTKDMVKNYPFAEGYQYIATYLESGFNIATLFTTEADYIFEVLLNKKTRIRKQTLQQR